MNDNGFVIYNKNVAFWGGIFSNFYPCSFYLKVNDKDTVKWKSSEQCFMAYKAYYFGDMDIYYKILQSDSPKEAKKLGRQVKNFNEESWSKVRYDIMSNIVYEKFLQNEELMNFLLSDKFDNKGFIEGSPFDGVWGVKMDYRNPDIDNNENWNGENLLGKVFNEIREKLKLWKKN